MVANPCCASANLQSDRFKNGCVVADYCCSILWPYLESFVSSRVVGRRALGGDRLRGGGSTVRRLMHRSTAQVAFATAF